MHLVRQEHAPPYDAPGHDRFAMRRLQGREAGPADAAWIGLSVIEPGGSTTLSASPLEKFYVVIEGELEVNCETPEGGMQREILGPLDSCRIAPHEARALANRSGRTARVLLVMAEPPRKAAPQPR